LLLLPPGLLQGLSCNEAQDAGGLPGLQDAAYPIDVKHCRATAVMSVHVLQLQLEATRLVTSSLV
jgi:hypothetical protein